MVKSSSSSNIINLALADDLFAAEPSDQSTYRTLLADCDQVGAYPTLLADSAETLFQQLTDDINWQSETIVMYGRKVTVPRLVAWYGDKGASYRYSGVIHHPLPWIEPLSLIRRQLEQVTGARFNSVLANLYRDGHDYMGWHSDNESELGTEPTIASVSLGGPRFFDFRNNQSQDKYRVELVPGSVLVMKGQFQQQWQHQVPKQLRVTQPRINLTYRFIHF
ncbi:MAG: alpha-ketoglutarate-dependent dioxygenase AlkB [Kangiellaceae bacterium]|jgi:alkylated DNA repair dioxygenase AlkB|nr:alpha-ketoglutarate-dependent dioxygenase AlkB [Kangiellaceae bacterium]